MDIVIRKATMEDSDYIFGLVNERTTRAISFTQKVITRKEHDEWFTRALNNDNIAYFIIENRSINERVGQLRVNHEGTLSLTIGENFRGLGYAPISVAELVSYMELNGVLPELKTIYAYISEDNVRSSKTFTRVGFKKTGIKFLYGNKCVTHSLDLNRKLSA